MKKSYLLRISTSLYDKVEKVAEEKDRSVNYIINEILENSFKNKIDDNVMKDLETYCKKSKMTTSQLIEQMLKAYSKTYKR